MRQLRLSDAEAIAYLPRKPVALVKRSLAEAEMVGKYKAVAARTWTSLVRASARSALTEATWSMWPSMKVGSGASSARETVIEGSAAAGSGSTPARLTRRWRAMARLYSASAMLLRPRSTSTSARRRSRSEATPAAARCWTISRLARAAWNTSSVAAMKASAATT